MSKLLTLTFLILSAEEPDQENRHEQQLKGDFLKKILTLALSVGSVSLSAVLPYSRETTQRNSE